MEIPAKTEWHLAGEQIGNCNCAWGCPCQFNALPTHGRCEGFSASQIWEGYFGDIKLDGVRFAGIYSWPGAVHEGNGTRQLIIDERATPEQRDALIALESGTRGGTHFEIFAAVCPNVFETTFAPIDLWIDRERRRAAWSIPGIGEARTEPIKNPVTGEEHRAKIVLPNGFEFKEAEMGNTTHLRIHSSPPLAFEHEDTYAQLYEFDWSN